MRIVTVVWSLDGDAARFERGVPLRFLGRRNRELGYSNDIHLVFLGGLDRLDPDYLGELRDLGFTLHDAAESYDRLAERTAPLARLNAFNHRSFLRWPILGELFAGEPLLHVDGDVIYNENPAVIAGHFSGRTLVLQGCSGIVAITNGAWYQAYSRALHDYLRDVEAYTAAALREWRVCEHQAAAKWAGGLSARFIAHEQDFLSHLICTDRIVQDDPELFVQGVPEYVYFENPLLIGSLVPQQPLRYARRGAIDFLGDRRVAIWHMQTDWCRYLAKQLLREKLGIFASRGRIGFGRQDAEATAGAVLRRATGERLFSRRAICQRCFQDGDFSGIFTAARWWQLGVFGAPDDPPRGGVSASALRG